MSISLEFGSHTNYSISESRLSLMMQGDKNSAIHINLWERFKDLFRIDKKSQAYNELYNLLHNTEGSDSLDAFNRLKSLAKPEHQHLFTKDIYCNDVVFFIGNKNITKCTLQSLINVSEQTPILSMRREEQQLFLAMLDTLRQKESLFSDSRPQAIRNMLSDEYCYELLNMYRPEEDMYASGTEWQIPVVITESEQDALRCLNAGSMTSFSQFSFIGYQTFASGVEFTMLHPCISFLLGTYIKERPDLCSFKEINSGFLNVLNKGYEDYNNNKAQVDSILSKVYHAHGETLNISYLGQNRNKLVAPPDLNNVPFYNY